MLCVPMQLRFLMILVTRRKVLRSAQKDNFNYNPLPVVPSWTNWPGDGVDLALDIHRFPPFSTLIIKPHGRSYQVPLFH